MRGAPLSAGNRQSSFVPALATTSLKPSYIRASSSRHPNYASATWRPLEDPEGASNRSRPHPSSADRAVKILRPTGKVIPRSYLTRENQREQQDDSIPIEGNPKIRRTMYQGRFVSNRQRRYTPGNSAIPRPEGAMAEASDPASNHRKTGDYLPNTDIEEHEEFVLTVIMTESLASFLTQLRTEYFPPHRNRLPAHICLFHALPGSQMPAIRSALETLCSSTESFQISAQESFKMGKRGVAVHIEKGRTNIRRLNEWLQNVWDRGGDGREPGHAQVSAEQIQAEAFQRRHDQDQQSSRGFLSHQDRQKTRPHVTILNKVDDSELIEHVKRVVQTRLEEFSHDNHETHLVTGVRLWKYDKAYWEHREDFLFKGPEGELLGRKKVLV